MKRIITLLLFLMSMVWANETPLKVDNEYKTDLYYSTDILFTVDEDEEEAVPRSQTVFGSVYIIHKKQISY